MENRTLYLTLFVLSLTSLTGCQKKVIYVTPQITGQVIDKQTNKPIQEAEVFISNKASDSTDNKGRFTVPFITSEYTFNEPSYQERRSRRGSGLTIYKSGYEIKSYANGGLPFTTSADGQKRYVNMGQVYLMPVPVGKERDYKNYYLTVGYCQPNQSQKEFDCIPVPEGKTYEQVSPNQPIK